MIWNIAAFEFRKRLGRLSTWVYFGVFFLLGFLLLIAGGGAFKSVSVALAGGGKVPVNAPFPLYTLITLISYFGLPVTAAISGQAVHQDFQHHIYPLFFTTPVRKPDYLLGRFFGALLVQIVIFSSIGLGCLVGSWMPFLLPSLIGPTRLAAYVWPYFISVIPNFVFMGAIFFTLATLTRKIAPVYVSSVVLLIGYLIATSVSVKLENRFVAGLIDPFGLHAARVVTEYWTIAEKRVLLMPLKGVLLLNRLIWVSGAAALLGYTLARFRFSEGGEIRQTTDLTVEAAEAATSLGPVEPTPTRPPRPLRLLPRLTWLAFTETVKNVYFLVFVLAGVLFMIQASRLLGSIYGTRTYPVTYMMVELVSGSFGLFMLIIIIFYSGELVWRERDAGMDQLFDALPVPTWLPFLSKLLALILVQVLLMAALMVCGTVIQVAKGYYHFELGVYIKQMFGFLLIMFVLLSILAMTVQVLVNNKYLGHFIMVVYYIAMSFTERFGFEHNLYRYANAPTAVYSDMNRFGPFVRPAVWFNFYYACAAVLLAMVANLFWVRGLEQGGGARIRLARARFSPRQRAVALLALAALVASGGFIYYNTNILNHYQTHADHDHERVDYENQYKKEEKTPQPRVSEVKLAIDLYPEKGELRSRGSYLLRNKTQMPIARILITLPSEAKVIRLALASEGRPPQADRRLGFYTLPLATPMPPGEARILEFELAYSTPGFKNSGAETQMVENGTFVSSSGYLPHIGYNSNAELEDDDTRQKYRLPLRERMPDVADVAGRRNNYVSRDADWITSDITVSTQKDQIGIAPGVLRGEWEAGGRRYFHYQGDSPMLNFFAILSARYQVLRDHWRDVDIEIYYHRGHEYNLPKMVKSIKMSLDYYTAHFSPYQHKMVRIMEFPRYRTFAQSLPGIIPYSEAIGFIARVDPKDEEDIDYPFYVTAHEVAHQWWAHQVIGGHVQGSTMLSETLAQYSALMVMKQEYGPEKIRRFLRYELNQYLSERGRERKKELPLERVENQQYIHYRKGSLVFYALQDYIGEERLNQALASYIKAVAFQEPPYTNSLELLDIIRKATPPELKYIIEDMFETITLFENRAVSASYKPVGARYEVKWTVTAKKLRADELGAEREVKLDDLIDVGVLGSDGRALYLRKQRIHEGNNQFSAVVDQLPVKAGIDPLNKLIDRKPDDNLIRVDRE